MILFHSMNSKVSVRITLLKALLPYSRENLQLSFKPHSFFNQLEAEKNLPFTTSKSSFYRLINQGLVYIEGDIPRLSNKGLRALAPYSAKRLKNSKLMVIFDIHECDRWKRNHLRATLREFKFDQIQKSVWVTDYDCRKYIEADVTQLRLTDEVRLFEVVSLS